MNSIGVCGDDCSVCPRRKATLEDDTTALERLKELWVSFGWREPDIDSQSLRCNGCGPGNPCAYAAIRDCALSRGYDTCGVCPEFPCAESRNSFEKSAAALRIIAGSGLCTPEEKDILVRSFFRKGENLERQRRLRDPMRTEP